MAFKNYLAIQKFNPPIQGDFFTVVNKRFCDSAVKGTIQLKPNNRGGS